LYIDNNRAISIDDSPYADSNILCSYIDENSFHDRYKNDKRLSVMTINVQSLPAKFSELSEMIMCMRNNMCNPDIICVQETWKIHDEDMFVIEGYHCPLFKLRKDSQGGGVAIYINSNFSYTILSKYSTSIEKIVESLFVEIKISEKKKYIFGSIYRSNTKYTAMSEKCQYELFEDFLTNVLSDINSNNVPTYITDDFNLDLLKYDVNDLVTDYVNDTFLNGFIHVITKPTRCASHSAT
jgi:exonuclease III